MTKVKYMTEKEQREFWRRHDESKEKLLERVSFGLGELSKEACNITSFEWDKKEKKVNV